MSDLSLSPDGTTLAVTLLNDSLSGGLEIRSVPALEPTTKVALPTGTVGGSRPTDGP